MSMQLDSNNRNIIPFVLFVFASFMILAVYLNENESGRIHKLQDGVIGAASVFQSGFRTVARPVINVWATASNFTNLISENKQLKIEVEQLKKEQLQKEQIREENQRLRNLLEFRKKIAYESMPAVIIGANTPFVSLVIDKGSQDGVGQNMPVVVNDGLVGKIYKIAGNASIVQLITDPKSAVGAKISETGDLGIVEGGISGKLYFRFNQNSDKVKNGYNVITSGMGGIFPKDIAIGKVTDVGLDRSSQQFTIEVKPSVDLAYLEQVFIITNPPEPLEKQFNDL